MKKYFLTAAFAVLAASPALAATHHNRTVSSVDAGSAYASYNDPDAVVVDGKVIGRDPDVFIRESLIREGDHANDNGGAN